MMQVLLKALSEIAARKENDFENEENETTVAVSRNTVRASADMAAWPAADLGAGIGRLCQHSSSSAFRQSDAKNHRASSRAICVCHAAAPA